DESVDDMHTRMNHIKNGFIALGESLTNSRVAGKLIRALPANWETLRVTLETMMAKQDLTPVDLLSHFRNFEARQNQRSDNTATTSHSRNLALPALGESRNERRRDNKRRDQKDLKSKKATHNLALMAGETPSMDEVIERAFQEMLLKQSHMPESLIHNQPHISSPTPEIDASHDSSHEVNLNLEFQSITSDRDSSSTNESEYTLELESHDDLVREVTRLRENEKENESMILALKDKVSTLELSV
ncbi:MAG TPA: hypothetical protein VIJ14_07060, partial [Rhabdochlamydiaceae bacterium]